MTRASPLQNVFNAGEMSPRMDARVDFDKYGAAVSRAQNLICLPQGGLTTAPGTRYIAQTKSGNARLIGFEPVAESSYVIEAGTTYLRFFKNQGQIVAATTDAVVTNGTFNADISGWTNASTGGGSVAWDSTRAAAQLSGTSSGYSALRQSISIGASFQGAVHVLRFRLLGNSFARGSCRIGTTAGASNLAVASELGVGWHTVAFTPGTGTIHIEFRNTEAFTVYLDDVMFLSNVPVEIASPYTADEAQKLRASQSFDVMYLFHEDRPVHKLQRRGDAAWSLVEVFFEDGPYEGINPGVNLGEANLISNFNFESGAAGWTKVVTGTGYVDYDRAQRVVFLRRRSPINPTSAADYNGTAEIRHQTSTANSGAVHVLHFQIVGGGEIQLAVGSTATGAEIVAAANYGAGWYSISFTPGVSTFFVRFTGNQDLEVIGGVGACYCYQTQSRLLAPSAKTGSITLSVTGSVSDVFRSTDVGRLIRLEWPGREPGYGMITAVTTTHIVTVQVLRELPETTPTESWRLGAFSGTTGYPKSGTFFQQRLWMGGTGASPQTIWATQTRGFENMRPDSWQAGAATVEADDAINATLAAKRISPIQWIVGTRRLVVGTSSGNWAFSSQGAALSPTDISAAQHTSVDCADIEAIQIDDVGIYVHRAKRSLYDIGFSYEIEGFRASDLTILSEHMNTLGIEQIEYQAEPLSTAWCRLNDGSLACMTYKRSQGVVGWTTRTLGGAGFVTSMAVIPGGSAASGQVYDSTSRDEVWLVVRRTINGNTVHYIEMMEGIFEGPNRARYLDHDLFLTDMRESQADAFYVDSGLTYKGASTSTLTGLSHLEGQTVKVVVDGAVQQDKTVTGGSITLDQAGLGATMTAHVGLGYEWVLRGMKLPYGAQAGTAVAKTKTVTRIGLTLLDSASFDYGVEVGNKVSLRAKSFRNAAVPMGEAVPLFTGETILDMDGGYDTDPRLIMRGNLPLPFTLLAIAPDMRTNERL